MPNYTCEFCNEVIFRKVDYIFHLYDNHEIENEEIKYKDCGCENPFRYIYLSDIEKHEIDVHKQKIDIVCKYGCDFKAKNRNQMDHHERATCKLIEDINCKYGCGIRDNPYRMKYHEENSCHLRDRYKCEECGFTTSKKYIFTKHAKSCQ